MIDPKLIEYIRSSLNRKIPIEEIKKPLLEKGWQESIINEAINLATEGSSPLTNSNNSQSINNSKKPETKPKKDSKHLGLIIGGIFIFILLIGVMVFIMMSSSGKLSDTQLIQGASVSLGENKEIRFDLIAEEHNIRLESLTGNSATLIVQSVPVNVTLAVGETKKFDFDDNDFYDLSIKLMNISNAKANLYVTKINEQICTEDWNCTSWGICENLSQTRVCEDINNCGTEKNKPIEIQACEDLSCSGQGGTVCSNYLETCDVVTINASDGVCCLGNCTSIAFIACTNLDCLITAAGSCHKSNLTYDFSSNILGWEQDNSRYYEITGRQDGKCELYEEVLSASGAYSDVKRQSLLDEGKTETEIDTLESDRNTLLENITGESGTCRYSNQELKGVLIDLNESGITLSIDDAPTYECTGNLYNSTYY